MARGKFLKAAIIRNFNGESQEELKGLIEILGFKGREEVNLNVLFAIERIEDKKFLNMLKRETQNGLVKREVSKRLRIMD
ncbi:MAG: hypothetical protein KGH49_02290 [Candidatus Micrarchaeota archaeon]|nr:hypothetical protein [Candidatus Micrarchaeota archaeon]